MQVAPTPVTLHPDISSLLLRCLPAIEVVRVSTVNGKPAELVRCGVALQLGSIISHNDRSLTLEP